MNYCRFRNDFIKRMANAGSVTPILPDAYQAVEYLQSSGTQYINIGAIGNHQYFDVDFARVGWVPNSAAQYNVNGLLGINSYTSSGVNDVKVWLTSANYITASVGSSQIGKAPIVVGTRYNLYFSNTQCLVDGQDYTTGTSSAFSGTPACYIFAVNTNSAQANFWSSAARIYRLKTNSIELYPCCRKTDSKPGMFDIVNNTFYTNVGSGEFTVGNNV